MLQSPNQHAHALATVHMAALGLWHLRTGTVQTHDTTQDESSRMVRQTSPLPARCGGYETCASTPLTAASTIIQRGVRHIAQCPAAMVMTPPSKPRQHSACSTMRAATMLKSKVRGRNAHCEAVPRPCDVGGTSRLSGCIALAAPLSSLLSPRWPAGRASRPVDDDLLELGEVDRLVVLQIGDKDHLLRLRLAHP